MKIIHSLPGRLRLQIDRIKQCPGLAACLENRLGLDQRIKQVTVNPITSRVLVYFAPEQISIAEISRQINETLALPVGTACSVERQGARTGPNKQPPYKLEKLSLKSQFGLTASTSLLLLINYFRDGKPAKRVIPGRRHILNVNTLLTIAAGIPLFRTALEQLLKKKRLSTEALVGTASMTALFLEDNNLGLFVLWLVYLNTLIRTATLESMRDRIRALLEGKKPTARLAGGAASPIIPAQQLIEGSLVEVRVGERIPADGRIKKGMGIINQLPITGTDCHQAVGPGKKAYAGSILLRGNLLVQAEQVGKNTRIKRIIQHFTEEKEKPDPATLRLLNKLSALALTMAGGYYLFTGNLQGALNILVAGIPAAAGLARVIPAEMGAACTAAHGALVKGGKEFAQLGELGLLLLEEGSFLTDNSLASQESINQLRRLNCKIPPRPIPQGCSCSPAEVKKFVRIIRGLQKSGKTVGMLAFDRGDTPTLSAVDVGIAAVSGDDLHLKSASIILLKDGPRSLVSVVRLARQAREIAVQNSAISLGSALIGMLLGLLNQLTPLRAGIFQNVGTLLILANSGRLLYSKSPLNSTAKQKKRTIHEKEFKFKWPVLELPNLFERLQTDPHGLTKRQVEERRKRFGPNELKIQPELSIWQVFLGQLDNYMSKVLLGLSGLSLLAGKAANALLSSGVLLANTGLAVLQEKQTQKSLQAFCGLIPANVSAIRGGTSIILPGTELVPGDLIMVKAGEKVPADARIVSSRGLVVQEATLTGEAAPVIKHAHAVGQKACIYLGTQVLAGYATAVVAQTGPLTEMGNIVQNIRSKNYYTTSPLYRRLDEVGNILARCGLGVTGLTMLMGFIRRQKLGESLTHATSLAVSVIPDGLVPMITMTLGLGAVRLFKQGIVARQLPVVDTLGCIDTLCWDKTGTLTQNKMKVAEIFTPGETPLLLNGKKTTNERASALESLFRAAVICNNAKLKLKQNNTIGAVGDSTEAALLCAAAQLGFIKLAEGYERINEIPFSPETMRMAVVCKSPNNEHWTFVKGAPEVIIRECRWLKRKGAAEQLTSKDRGQLASLAAKMSQRGLRVLAFAYAVELEQSRTPIIKNRLIFAGLMGISDPPRLEAVNTISLCRRAGICSLMVTGDHRETAFAIAKRVGIIQPSSEHLDFAVLTGDQFEQLTKAQLEKALKTVRVYARMSPVHKLQLIQALKQSGRVVGMIGDGVNDAPSIRAAHVGIAVNQNGKGVSQRVAPITLPNGNVRHLPAAINESRGVYENIRKSLRYSLTTNLSDGVSIMWSTLLGKQISIGPQQLLWVNITSDPLISWLLANDLPQPGLLSRPPRTPNESIFAHGLGQRIISNSLITGIAGILVDTWSARRGDPSELSKTLSMATSALSRLWQLTDSRRADNRYKGKLPPNAGFAYAAAWMLLPIGAAIYLPWLKPIFKTSPLRQSHWRAAIIGSTGGFLADKALNFVLNSVSNPKLPPKEEKTVKGAGAGPYPPQILF